MTSNMRAAVKRSIAADFDGVHGTPRFKRFYDTNRYAYREAVLIDIGRPQRGRPLPHLAINERMAHTSHARRSVHNRATVVAYVAAHPGAIVTEIAADTGFSLDVVRRLVRSGLDAGLLHRRKIERDARTYNAWYIGMAEDR